MTSAARSGAARGAGGSGRSEVRHLVSSAHRTSDQVRRLLERPADEILQALQDRSALQAMGDLQQQIATLIHFVISGGLGSANDAAGPAQALSETEGFEALAQQAAARGQQHFAALVEHGELLTPTELAARLGWTRQALSRALSARRVFYVELEGRRCYPAFFADPTYERRQLETVSRALGDLPGATKLRFMTSAKGSLGGLTPLQALAQGQVGEVLRTAQGFAER
ncbi:MarR family transcriptional regulator [Azohydromonas aeria]|uniref:MarR family transcriptional regulator n=1 Tax=Azohydromonas aeria TaxID=2590212 RepID=UPI0012FC1217|nr:MarR family transcriptional regulator [Azohydromonas aeria]